MSDGLRMLVHTVLCGAVIVLFHAVFTVWDEQVRKPEELERCPMCLGKGMVPKLKEVVP